MYGERYGRDDEFDGQTYSHYRPAGAYEGAAGGSSVSREQERHAVVGLDDDDSWRARARRKRRNMPLWQELPLLLVVAFCLAVLIRTFLLQAFYIPSGSMEDTLLVGDRVLVNKVVYDMRDPERGEIVVFRGTDAWVPENSTDSDIGFFAKLGRTVGDLVGISRPGEKDFIKRVIGLPGDRVSCCDVQGRVYVNGYPLDEPYVTENAPVDAPPNPKECRSRRFNEIVVEPGQLFVMGDHRLVSQDSRCQGQVPIENVIGRAFAIVWPSGRWDGLSVPATFEHVPKPFAASGPGAVSPDLNRRSSAPLIPGGLAVVLPILFASPLPQRSPLAVASRRRRLAG
jgi:signal peptidase I